MYRLAPAVVLILVLLAGCTAGDAPVEETAGLTLDEEPVLNIAHRGASGRAPENTFAAYDLALKLGADYIEQDVRKTRDDVLIVYHNENLDRSVRGPAACKGPVAEKTLEQLKTCDVGETAKIPTLEEVFRRYREDANFYIDIKDTGAPRIEEKLLRLMEEHGLREPSDGRWRVIVVSFEESNLRTLHELEPSLPLTRAYPGSETSESIRATLDETRGYAVGINPWRDDVDEALIEAAHEHCLQVYPYTASTKPDMERLISLGVDSIFTGFPGRLDEVLGEKSATTERAARLVAKRHASCLAR